jgi:hypothetical protein
VRHNASSVAPTGGVGGTVEVGGTSGAGLDRKIVAPERLALCATGVIDIVRIRIGDAEITPIVDAIGVLGDLGALFPRVDEHEWGPYKQSYASLFDGPGWRVPFGCFLVSIAGTTCLIDTGIGPPPGTFLPTRQGWLLEGLNAACVALDEIDVCVLTHLHVDHIGWVTTTDMEPTFSKARHSLHRPIGSGFTEENPRSEIKWSRSWFHSHRPASWN